MVNYNEAVNVIRMRNNRDPYIAYSDLFPVPTFEIPQQKVIIPDLKDDEDQTFSFEISGLKDNTTYLVCYHREPERSFFISFRCYNYYHL